MVYIIAGEKNSGKTSMMINVFSETGFGKGVISLKRYCNNFFKGYDAFVFPDTIIMNLCDMYDKSSGNCTYSGENFVYSGNYRFSQKTFDIIYDHIFNENKSLDYQLKTSKYNINRNLKRSGKYLQNNLQNDSKPMEYGYFPVENDDYFLDYFKRNAAIPYSRDSKLNMIKDNIVSKIKKINQEKKEIVWIDEIGKLEIQKHGFYKLLKKAMDNEDSLVCCINYKNINDFIKIADCKEYEIYEV